jgi:hypothetical protein
MRPVVVWENMGIETARIRQTKPKTRMPFDGERIYDLQILKKMEESLVAKLATAFDLET